MASLNRVTLIGRLTDQPAVKTIGGGTTVCGFRFAVGRSKKNANTGQWENDPHALFIDCEAFAKADARRNLPELIMQYVHKGDPLYIEGRLQLDQWEEDGQKRSKHKLIVDNIEFLGGGTKDKQPEAVGVGGQEVDGGLIPF